MELPLCQHSTQKLACAQQHGHSEQVVLTIYGGWVEDSREALDIT
jgi:hypothetical protein